MSYSFIKPRRKYLVEGDTKFWLLFITTSVSLLIGFSLFLEFKVSDTMAKSKNAKERQIVLESNIEKRRADIEFIKGQIGKAKGIFISNQIIRDSIENLFNLVPKEITLEEVDMRERELIIRGTTPSKDIYNIGLLAPLKALFTKNSTTFYMLESGWFKFVSINKIEDFDSEMRE